MITKVFDRPGCEIIEEVDDHDSFQDCVDKIVEDVVAEEELDKSNIDTDRSLDSASDLEEDVQASEQTPASGIHNYTKQATTTTV